MRIAATLFAATALLVLAFTVQAASAATLTADYQLQNSDASSVPGAPYLDRVGPGTQFVTETVGCGTQRVLSFPKGSGVQVANPNGEDGNYTVVVLFRLADLSGYRRIFAPTGLNSTTFSTDNGVYVRDTSLAVYDNTTLGFPFQSSAGVFQPNTYAEVILSYSSEKGNTERYYVNGVERASYAPSDSGAFYASFMRFFKDNDTGGVTNEDSAGAVARIRIYHAGSLTPQEIGSIHAASPIAGACDPTKLAKAAVGGKVKVKNGDNGRFVVLTGIEVSCPAGGGTCDGGASVTRGAKAGRATASKLPRKLGKAKLSVAAGASKAVRVKLTKKASDALRDKGKLKAKISVKLAAPGGTPAIASRTAKLKPPR